MKIDEARWQAAWAFLSLSKIEDFFEDLWIPIDNPGEFQRELRSTISPWFEAERYYHEQGPFNYALTEWFENSYGQKALSKLNCWVREVFCYRGSDRIPETIWSAVSYNLPRMASAGLVTSSWIVELMDRVKSTQQEGRLSFESKLERAGKKVSNKWDAKIRKFQFSTAKGTTSAIHLIGTSNIFLAAWEKHCSQLQFDQLFEIWKIGKTVASHRQMDDLEMAFPSSWRFISCKNE